MCLDVYLFSSDVKKKKRNVDNSRLRQLEDLKMKSQNAISNSSMERIPTKIVEELTGSQEVRMNLYISETISAAAQRVWSGQETFSFSFVSSASFYSVFPCFNGAIFF